MGPVKLWTIAPDARSSPWLAAATVTSCAKVESELILWRGSRGLTARAGKFLN